MTDKQATSGDDSLDDVETVATDSGSENADSDVQSDPSGDQHWSGEGGASEQGPATDPRNG
ncbi:hypothetical protein [Rhodococcus sp. 24CO]|uniref:hypothetical protein n=1 Tax=Rhodococcus sp. 24CO TaxID=3117460 RepID=UPI003D338B68